MGCCRLPTPMHALCIVQALMLPADAPADGGGLVQDWLEGGKLGKALLRRYDDVGESCRELAVGTLSGLMQVGGWWGGEGSTVVVRRCGSFVSGASSGHT